MDSQEALELQFYQKTDLRGKSSKNGVKSNNTIRKAKVKWERPSTLETIRREVVKKEPGRNFTVIDDGEMREWMPYSLNKKKRWLLLETVEQEMTENKEFLESEENKSHVRAHIGGKSNNSRLNRWYKTQYKQWEQESNGQTEQARQKKQEQESQLKQKREEEEAQRRMDKKKKHRKHHTDQEDSKQDGNAESSQNTEFKSNPKDKVQNKIFFKNDVHEMYVVEWAPKRNDKRQHDQDDHGYWSPEYCFGIPEKNPEAKRRRAARQEVTEILKF